MQVVLLWIVVVHRDVQGVLHSASAGAGDDDASPCGLLTAQNDCVRAAFVVFSAHPSQCQFFFDVRYRSLGEKRRRQRERGKNKCDTGVAGADRCGGAAAISGMSVAVQAEAG